MQGSCLRVLSSRIRKVTVPAGSCIHLWRRIVPTGSFHCFSMGKRGPDGVLGGRGRGDRGGGRGQRSHNEYGSKRKKYMIGYAPRNAKSDQIPRGACGILGT